MGSYVFEADMSSPRAAVESVIAGSPALEGLRLDEIVEVHFDRWVVRGEGAYHLWALLKVNGRHYGYEGVVFSREAKGLGVRAASNGFRNVVSVKNTPANAYQWGVGDYRSAVTERGYVSLTDDTVL